MTTPAARSRARSASQADVAARAGVSAQTVSRVANESTSVDPSTRARVLAAMRELGYQPNSAARALATGRYSSIGVIAFTMSESGDVHTIDAIARASRSLGFSLNLVQVDVASTGRLDEAVANLASQSVDGLIVIEAAILDSGQVVTPVGLPVVVTEDLPGLSHPRVSSDLVSGTERAVRHLLDLGHRTVHHVSGPASSHSARGRELVWRRVLTEQGSPVPRVVRGDWSAASGHQAGQVLAGDPEVTAIFCANDQMALGVLNALHAAGRRVPEDVSVVGFDGEDDAAYFWPPLTTVRQDFGRIGELCVRSILDRLDGVEDGPENQVVPVDLIVRDSTGRAPR